jgi:hypothetical protein
MHQFIAQVNALSFNESNVGWGDSGALIVAAADADVAGTSKIAPKWHSMVASLEVVLSRPQAVMPLALSQR